MLHIFGMCSRRLVLITAPGHRAEADVKGYWPGTEVYCIYLVGSHAISVCLGWYTLQLRNPMPPSVVPGSTFLVYT